MRWHIGTMGFGYPDWAKAGFYPPGTKSTDYLAAYARHFDTVELDTTFHGAPTAERVRKWAEAVPDSFRFCAKAPREVTHDSPIFGSAKPMLRFLDAMRSFGDKLAVIVLQFPPTFSAAEFQNLRTFLLQMPPDVRMAVEFRHGSWEQERTFEMLRETSVAWVAADYDQHPNPVHITTDFVYVRWVGVHGRYRPHDQERVDLTDRLRWWKDHLEKRAGPDADHPPVRDVYGFFNNDFAGYAPATAERFKALLGQVPVGAGHGPDLNVGEQGRLF